MLSKAKLTWTLPGVIVLACFGVGQSGDEKLGAEPQEVQAVLDKARDFLKSKQLPDGSFAPKVGGPGVTALVVAALARNGVSPADPVTFLGAAILMAAVTLLACYIPTRRAMHVDPLVALRAVQDGNTGALPVVIVYALAPIRWSFRKASRSELIRSALVVGMP